MINTNNKSQNEKKMSDIQPQHTLDTRGLICPEPVMLLHKAVRSAKAGEVIEILATDPATTRDIPNFCRHLGHTLIEQNQTGEGDDAKYIYLIEKKSS